MARIGVLALQGGYAAHVRALGELGHPSFEVREAAQLDGLDGLVLPGGESSTQLKLLARFAMEAPIDAFARSGRPVLATCAGLILAAREVRRPVQRCFGWLDVAVERNAYGRQLQSFEAVADDGELPLVFIRAPRIEEIGPAVEVLATMDGAPIVVRQGAFVGAAFHPELTADRRVHRWVFGDGGGA